MNLQYKFSGTYHVSSASSGSEAAGWVKNCFVITAIVNQLEVKILHQQLKTSLIQDIINRNSIW